MSFSISLSDPSFDFGYADIPDAADLQITSDFTLAIWVYFIGAPSSFGLDMGWLFNKGTTSCGGNFQLGIYSSGQIVAGIGAGNCSSNAYLFSSGNVPTNTWTRIVFTYSAGTTTGSIYINGSLDNSSGSMSESMSGFPGSDVIIGNSNYTGLTSTATQLEGYWTEAAIYSRCLSSSEVSTGQPYTVPFISNAGLVLYLPTTEGTGSTTADGSGNSNNASLTGTFSWVSSYPPITSPEPNFEDDALILDALILDVTETFDDNLIIDDSEFAGDQIPSSELDVIQDFLLQIVTLNFTDLLLPQESQLQSYNEFFTIQINPSVAQTEFFTVQPSIGQMGTGFYSVMIPPQIDTLVPVTNATSVNNDFQATLVVQGTALYTGSGNPPPPSLANTSVYVSYLNAGVTNLNLCALYNFNMTLDDNGGSFSATSLTALGDGFLQPGESTYPQPTLNYGGMTLGPELVPANLGENIQFFGFNGSVVESGRVRSNSADGFTVQGIFGNPLMNRQFGLLGFAQGQILSQLVPSNALTVLGALASTNNPRLTCMGAAQAIVSVVNEYSGQAPQITLQWSAQDAPYVDTLAQAGATALEALNNLAGRCSAVLRWDGNNNYRVTYPDVAFGTWIVPDCHLIGAGGLEYEVLLDLGTGRSGTGVLIVPYNAQSNITQNSVPGTTPKTGGVPTVTQVAKITKALDSGSPPLIYDLPQDYQDVYVQFLVQAGSDLSGGTALRSGLTTYDPQQWFPFDVGVSTSDYIFMTQIGGRYIPQVRIDSTLFPAGNANLPPTANPAEFVFSVACTRQDLSAQFQQAQQNLANLQQMLAVQNYRFVKTYDGTINCLFFGSIPLPGMLAQATSGDMTVNGVVESVSFQYPGFLTVKVAKYLRLSMQTPPINWNAVNPGDYRGYGT